MSQIKQLVTFLALLTISFACCSQVKVAEEKVLRSGFLLSSFPDTSRTDLEVSLRYWSEQVGEQTGIPSKVFFYSNVDKMRKAFYQDEIDFIVASPLVIVNEFDLTLLAEGYKVVVNGSAKDKLLVVTNKKTKINQFKDVKKKQLSLLLNDPISMMYGNVLALQNFKKPAKSIFKKINFIPKSTQLIYRLFFNKTDVVFVYQAAYLLAVELNPQIGLQTQVIVELDNIPRALGYFHQRVDPEYREIVIAEVEKLHTHSMGKQLLSIFQADKIERSSIVDLESTQNLLRSYQQLSAQIQD